MRKRCTKCTHPKRSSAFSKSAKASDGLYVWCKPCARKMKRKYRSDPMVKAKEARSHKKWVKAHPGYYRDYDKKWKKRNPRKVRESQLKTKFDVDNGWYSSTLRKQRGRCAICRTKAPGGKGGKHFAVDHDHRTGQVRGLLCARCNLGLGQFRDSLARVKRVVTYLEQFSAVRS